MTDCVAHVPHKGWADDGQEHQNYLAIERWSRQVHDDPRPGSDGIHLLIPSKHWSGDRHEFENYLEIERWARRFQIECIGEGVTGPKAVTAYPDPAYGYVFPDTHDTKRIRVRFNPWTVSGGVTPVEFDGADATGFALPAGTYSNISAHFEFYEPTSATDGALRTLEIEVFGMVTGNYPFTNSDTAFGPRNTILVCDTAITPPITLTETGFLRVHVDFGSLGVPAGYANPATAATVASLTINE